MRREKAIQKFDLGSGADRILRIFDFDKEDFSRHPKKYMTRILRLPTFDCDEREMEEAFKEEIHNEEVVKNPIPMIFCDPEEFPIESEKVINFNQFLMFEKSKILEDFKSVFCPKLVCPICNRTLKNGCALGGHMTKAHKGRSKRAQIEEFLKEEDLQVNRQQNT